MNDAKYEDQQPLDETFDSPFRAEKAPAAETPPTGLSGDTILAMDEIARDAQIDREEQGFRALSDKEQVVVNAARCDTEITDLYHRPRPEYVLIVTLNGDNLQTFSNMIPVSVLQGIVSELNVHVMAMSLGMEPEAVRAIMQQQRAAPRAPSEFFDALEDNQTEIN